MSQSTQQNDDDAQPTIHDDLTAFQWDLLAAVDSLGRTRGTKVKETLEDYYSEEVNHGRLYPNLDELVWSGLVEKGEIDRRTNSYETTVVGRRLIQQRARWLGEGPEVSDDE